MNASGTNCLRDDANGWTLSPLRRVLARPSMTGRQTVAARGAWQPREAAKPGEVLKAKSPPPARHSVESSRQLRPVSGGEGPEAAGRLRRAGQDRRGHGTPRARLFEGSPGVVLCPLATGLTRELVGSLRKGSRASKDTETPSKTYATRRVSRSPSAPKNRAPPPGAHPSGASAA